MRKQLSFWLSIISIGLFTSCGGDDAAPEPTPTISAPLVEGLFQPEGELVISFTTTGTFKEGNIFKAQLSDSNGSFTNPIEIGTLAATTPANIEATLPASVNNGTQYRIRIVSTEPAIISPDNGANLSIAAPTITITVINTLPQSGQTYVAGRAIRLRFVKTGVFASNNRFKIQMSDASGNFTNPTQIADLDNSLGETYDTSLPNNITAGTYKFRVVTTSPASTSVASESINVVNIILSAPTVTGNLSAGGLINVTTNITNGPLLPGNFSYQLSNSSGSFANPIVLSTFQSPPNTQIQVNNIILPTNLPAGNGYRIRAVSTLPNVQVDSSPLTIGALPTLTLTEAAPAFTKMYASSPNNISYFMYYNFTVQSTGTFNFNTFFTVEYTYDDVIYQSTNISLSGLVANTLISTGTVSFFVGVRNLQPGTVKFRVKANGHDVVSNTRSYQVFSTAVNSMAMTLDGVTYNFPFNRTVANSASGASNNRSLFIAGEADYNIGTVSKIRGFMTFTLSNETINIGSGSVNVGITVFYLDGVGNFLSTSYNNSTTVTATISGGPTGYTGTINGATLNKSATSTGPGPASLSLTGGSFNFKLQ